MNIELSSGVKAFIACMILMVAGILMFGVAQILKQSNSNTQVIPTFPFTLACIDNHLYVVTDKGIALKFPPDNC